MLNNKNNTSCTFKEQIIECLYGEINSDDRLKLETHMNNCISCADEFAAFGFVHKSVIEWRDADFSHLETPNFNLPALTAAISKNKKPDFWFDNIKKLFVFRPVAAISALGILLICAGITIISLNLVKVDDRAEFSKNEVQKSITAPTVEKTTVLPAVNEVEKPSEPIIPKQASDTKGQPRIAIDKSAVKVSNRSNESPTPPVRNPKAAKIREKQMPSQKQRIPDINEIEEIEDKSIRLADLFEEIGTE